LLHPEFFHNGAGECNHEDLTQFKALAEQWVDECIIR